VFDCNSEEKFVKKTLKLERLNSDPEYFRQKIREAFPELSAGGVDGRMFKLWQVRENKTELIALPVDINNAQALFGFEELNRSCVYIKADVSKNYVITVLFESYEHQIELDSFNTVLYYVALVFDSAFRRLRFVYFLLLDVYFCRN